MRDRLGREINYLRLSLTERCNLRCTYCRADEGLCPKAEELSAGQFERITRVFAGLGVNRVRLTGGEPMLRKDLLDIIARIAGIEGIDDLSMTTNAQFLAGMSPALKTAGLQRLNISLDSLDAQKFERLTHGRLDLVLQGIDEALAAGLLPLKLNVVVIPGVNDMEIDDFIALTRQRAIDVRFIELMPLGASGKAQPLRVSNQDLLAARPYLQAVAPRKPGQASSDYQVQGYLGRVGFISPISHKFCGQCNRMRLLSDGTLRPCLGVETEISLLPALAQGDEALRELIEDVVYNKPAGHAFETAAYNHRDMSRIGG